MDIDLDRLSELMRLMDEHDLAELEMEGENFKIRLRKAAGEKGPEVVAVSGVTPVAVPAGGNLTQQTPSAAAPSSAESQPPPPEEDLIEITSPMVGTFYRAPAPDAEPYVRVGDVVHEDTVVCIIEAMKVMNEIKAETEGTIVAVVAEDGQTVEFGQVLFKVKPAR